MPQKLFLHLPAALRKSVDAGQHNFFKILRQTFEEIGVKTYTRTQHANWRAKLVGFDQNLHIFHIDGAVGPSALNVRRAHFYPFWSLENAGTRHSTRIAGQEFNPAKIDSLKAQVFFNKICVRNLPAAPQTLPEDDFVFIPLQGRLLDRRHWQFADCKQMVDTVLSHDKSRKIWIKPHPRETYSSAEKSFIQELASNPRVHITDADTHSLLSQCAYVVTQNSGAAFEGFLYQKPAILFAKSDFHHICQTVASPDDAKGCFAKITSERPAFEKFIYWYLQLNCINAGRQDAGAAILKMTRDCGWNLPNAPKPE